MMPSPLREIDPDQPKRLHTFGNPFKQDKKVKICQGKSVLYKITNQNMSLLILDLYLFVMFPQTFISGDDD